MTGMKITPRVAMEVLQHEGIVLEAYKCSAGVWTWSVGIAETGGYNVKQYKDNPQTIEAALEAYVEALESDYAPSVRKAFEGCDLTEAQLAAALSFHYNTGGILRASWVQRFKEGNVAAAKAAFMNWRKPPEILSRRRAERDLFSTADGKATDAL